MQLAFYKARRGGWKGLFDRAVRWWTSGPYSHVELVLADGTCWSSSNRDGGVRAKWINLTPRHWDILPVAGDERAALAFFEQHQGAKYDFLGLFGFILRPYRGDTRRWFCSEICAVALGYPDGWRFDPNTLAAAVRGQGNRAYA